MTNKLDRIMLIDDDDSDNFLHKMIIEEMGIANEVTVAEDGAEALEMLKKEGQKQPELIFLDINMPKVNGWEFLAEYGRLGLQDVGKTIIIILTTSLNPNDEKRATSEFSKQISGYYIKPLTEEILQKLLSTFF
jgi:CheY-like chemotaxis protein